MYLLLFLNFSVFYESIRFLLVFGDFLLPCFLSALQSYAPAGVRPPRYAV